MLLNSPYSHNVPCCCQEEVPSPSLGGNVKSDPLPNLSSIICTSDVVEQKPGRNLVTPLSIQRSQVLQDDVTVKVRDLAHNRNRKSHVHLRLTHWSVQRVIHKVGNVGPKQPVAWLKRWMQKVSNSRLA